LRGAAHDPRKNQSPALRAGTGRVSRLPGGGIFTSGRGGVDLAVLSTSPTEGGGGGGEMGENRPQGVGAPKNPKSGNLAPATGRGYSFSRGARFLEFLSPGFPGAGAPDRPPPQSYPHLRGRVFEGERRSCLFLTWALRYVPGRRTNGGLAGAGIRGRCPPALRGRGKHHSPERRTAAWNGPRMGRRGLN